MLGEQSSPALERFVCPLCELGLSDGESLEQHMMVHAGEQASFVCDVCGKSCPDAAMFGKHLRLHTGERPFKCEQCDKSFREKCSLTRHIRTHTGEKPFRCEVCSKCFSDVGSFGRHKKTHMGSFAKVHKCPFDLCDKSFIDKSSLNRHVKTHTGEKPYVCQVCAKCFTESGSYKRHLRVHTGEKRYKCRACGRAFSERASMVRHERNVCMLLPDQEVEDDKETEECSSLYSLTDFYRSYMGKQTDILNNNVIPYVHNEHKSTTLQNDHTDPDLNQPTHMETNFHHTPKSPSTSLKENGNGNFPILDFNHHTETLSNDDSSSVPQSCSASEGQDGGSDQQDSWKVLSELNGDWPRGENSEGSASVIRSIAPKMFEFRPVLENKRKEMKAKERKSLQMCFECGDAVSDAEDEDKTAVDTTTSTQPHASKRALRCQACRQEAASFTAEVDSPPLSVPDLSHDALLSSTVTDEDSQAAKTPTLKEENNINNPSSTPDIPQHSQKGRRHVCSHCGKAFVDSSKLKRHVKIHLNMRDFVCKVCGKAFIEACSLRRHESVHSDVKPHNCSLCGKGFTDSSGLKKHLVKCNGQAKVMVDVKEVLGKNFNKDVRCNVRKVYTAVKNIKKENESFSLGNLRNGESLGMEFTSGEDGINSNPVDVSDAKIKEKYKKSDHIMDHEPSQPTNITPIHNIKQETSPPPFPNPHPDSLSDSDSHMLYICRECGASCQDAASLRQHFHTHMLSTAASINLDNAVSCPVCNKLFMSALYLQKHIHNHHSQLPVSFPDSVSQETLEAAASLSLLSRFGDLHTFSAKPSTSKVFTPACEESDSLIKSSGCKDSKVDSLVSSVTKESEVDSLFVSSATKASNGDNLTKASNVDNLTKASNVNNLTSFASKVSDVDNLTVSASQQCKIDSLTSSVSKESNMASLLTSYNKHTSQIVSELLSVYSSSGKNLTESMSPVAYTQTLCNESEERNSSVKSSPNILVSKSSVINSTQEILNVFPKSNSFDRHTKHSSEYENFSQTSSPKLWTTENPNIKTLNDNLNLEDISSTTHSQQLQRTSPLSGAISQSPNSRMNCEICGKVFADASSLKRHARLHSDQRGQFLCENCDKVFSDQGSLKRHWLRGCKGGDVAMATGSCNSFSGTPVVAVTDSPEDGFACTQCKMLFHSRQDQMTHEKQHRVTPSLRCSVCRQSFPDSASLQHHQKAHASSQSHACDVCLKGFAESGSLSKHRARGCYAHSSVVLDSSKFPCADCGKVFSDQFNFAQHVTSHLGGRVKVKPYSCAHCGKSFAEACSLKRHTRLHTGQNLCRCLHCGRTFLENSGLKKHLQRGSCMKDKKKVVKSWLYPCTHCDKVFTKRYILIRHMKTHLGLRPFACDKCDKTFTESSSLKRHYRQHTGERPYECQRCHKCFTDTAVLKKHAQRCSLPVVNDDDDDDDENNNDNRQPSLDWPSLYLFNGSSFSKKFASHLKSQFRYSFQKGVPVTSTPKPTQRTDHKAQNKSYLPFFHSKKCWRCDRVFSSRQLLERHVKTVHVGICSFSCRLCWRRFPSLSYLRVHKRLQHKS